MGAFVLKTIEKGACAKKNLNWNTFTEDICRKYGPLSICI